MNAGTAEELGTRGDAVAYDARSIVVLRGLAPVRRNPALYVGSTGPKGLHHLVHELIDNAIDEAHAGFCSEIHVTVHRDGTCSVEDDGRGIPTDMHPEVKRPACEVVLTTLHAGSKFQGASYSRSAGLHGVGLSCVNALSETLELTAWRDGFVHRQTFARGEATSELTRVEPTTRQGTRIRFAPDPSIFDTIELSADVLVARLEELAFLHPGLRTRFVDERTNEALAQSHMTGLRGFLAHKNRNVRPVHAEPFVIAGRQGELSFEAAFQWTEGYAEQITSFVNSVGTVYGGTHVDGFKAALVGTMNRFAAESGLLKRSSGERIASLDLLEGLTAIVSLRMGHPEFEGQTKAKLSSPAAADAVRAAVEAGLERQLRADGAIGLAVVQRALNAARARQAARLAVKTTSYRRRELEIDYEAYRQQFGIRSKTWHDSCAWLTDDGLLSAHAALCEAAPSARLLDVCCGSGVVGNAFRGRVGERIGLDLTPEMVREASKRLDEVHQGTVYEIPFPDASFDVVCTREVLHLLPRPERPVSEIFRVLRPGGQFIVGQIVPYAEEDAYWMFRIFKKKQPLLHHMFREEDFRRLLLGAGFVDVKMEEYFLWESIDRWIDTHETTPLHRQEIYRLYYKAPEEVRRVHPFEVTASGAVRDRWRWCVYSLKKPAA